MVLLLSPHAVALIASPNGLTHPLMFQFEIAANLALVPLLAAMPYTDRLFRDFWRAFVRHQVETPGQQTDRFAHLLQTSALTAVHRLSVFLAGSSLLVVTASEVVLRVSPQVRADLHVLDVAAFETTLWITLAAYGMIGRGYLEVAWALSLHKPSVGLVSAAAGAAVSFAVAPLIAGGFPSTSPIATLLGSTTFAAISVAQRRRLIAGDAHHFVVMD